MGSRLPRVLGVWTIPQPRRLLHGRTDFQQLPQSPRSIRGANQFQPLQCAAVRVHVLAASRNSRFNAPSNSLWRNRSAATRRASTCCLRRSSAGLFRLFGTEILIRAKRIERAIGTDAVPYTLLPVRVGTAALAIKTFRVERST